jgi:hypothetical protein
LKFLRNWIKWLAAAVADGVEVRIDQIFWELFPAKRAVQQYVLVSRIASYRKTV